MAVLGRERGSSGKLLSFGCPRETIPGFPLVHTGFLVLNANRPYHRKRLDITLKGFAQFAEGKPENVFMYLHQTSTDDYTNQRMRRLVVSFGLEKRVLINVLNVNGESLTEQQINLLRNVSTTLRQPAFEFKLGFSAFGLAG